MSSILIPSLKKIVGVVFEKIKKLTKCRFLGKSPYTPLLFVSQYVNRGSLEEMSYPISQHTLLSETPDTQSEAQVFGHLTCCEGHTGIPFYNTHSSLMTNHCTILRPDMPLQYCEYNSPTESMYTHLHHFQKGNLLLVAGINPFNTFLHEHFHTYL